MHAHAHMLLVIHIVHVGFWCDFLRYKKLFECRPRWWARTYHINNIITTFLYVRFKDVDDQVWHSANFIFFCACVWPNDWPTEWFLFSPEKWSRSCQAGRKTLTADFVQLPFHTFIMKWCSFRKCYYFAALIHWMRSFSLMESFIAATTFGINSMFYKMIIKSKSIIYGAIYGELRYVNRKYLLCVWRFISSLSSSKLHSKIPSWFCSQHYFLHLFVSLCPPLLGNENLNDEHIKIRCVNILSTKIKKIYI